MRSDPDEKLNQFREFWRRHSDPAHNSDMEALERYFDRIYYSAEHFAEDQPGWKTDRGRTYTLYGPPDRQSSFRLAETFFEVWTYRKWGLRFLFRANDAGGMEAVHPGG